MAGAIVREVAAAAARSTVAGKLHTANDQPSWAGHVGLVLTMLGIAGALGGGAFHTFAAL